ncbi:MAG: acyl-CoA thioesterase [Acidimicrobiia bacterium]
MRLALDPSTDPADYGFRHRLRVRFAETDAMGVVHHAAYLPYLEEARVAWLRSIGHAYDTVRAEGVDFGVLEAFVQYRMALRFDEVVDVHLRLGAVTRTTFQVAYLLTVDGDVRATGVTVHGAMNMAGRPTRLPAWVATLPT